MDYEKKELQALEKIGKVLGKLDDTCAKIDEKTKTFFGKIKHFYEQEKALHEIKVLIKECNQIEKLEAEMPAKAASDACKHDDLRNKNLKAIADTMDALSANLDKLDESDGSKIKSFIYQAKSLYDIKKILHHINLYDKYSADELNDLAKLDD